MKMRNLYRLYHAQRNEGSDYSRISGEKNSVAYEKQAGRLVRGIALLQFKTFVLQ